MCWWQKRKLRLTISLCTSMAGERVKSLSTWKYVNPWCFKNIKKKKLLPVDYFSNKNARMTFGIFETWLKALDWKMRFFTFPRQQNTPCWYQFKKHQVTIFPCQHNIYLTTDRSRFYSSNKNKVQKVATTKFDYKAWKRQIKVLQWFT